METKQSTYCSLLELPDSCLLVMLQCLAADSKDPASLASAACTHSRLHQAAVAALSSVSASLVSRWDMDSLLLYLDRHGQHINSLDSAARLDDRLLSFITLRQLPTSLSQLSSLQLQSMNLQLQPGGGFQGVVRPGLPLKHLRLHGCALLGGEEGLAAALALLPGLEHLSYTGEALGVRRSTTWFPPEALLQLQRLTYLNLRLEKDPSQGRSALALQALSRLVDLRLSLSNDFKITTDMLSNAPNLTRLDLSCTELVEPGALAGKTALQHLHLDDFNTVGDAAGVVQLLSHVRHMQQLTHLEWGRGLVAGEHIPPAAAFAALTASSRLQALRFSSCILPAGVWQHVFPAGWQLPHLRSLYMYNVTLPSDERAAAPEGSRLVSCCPGLQYLSMEHMQCSAAHLAELQGLLALRTLHVPCSTGDEVQAVGLLTRLEELCICYKWPTAGQAANNEVLLHLARLQQLARLQYSGPLLGREPLLLQTKAPGDEPVWRQLLQRLADSDSDVAHQAAAALAGP